MPPQTRLCQKINLPFFSSLFSDIDEKHQKIFKETLELMKKNIDCLLEEK